MNKLFYILCLIMYSEVNAQKEHGLNWIMGGGQVYTISYKTGFPVITPFSLNFQHYFCLGSSCISDTDGNMKLLCNGYKLMDSSGITIEGGDTLTPRKITQQYGFSCYSQSSLILPFKNDVYSVITNTMSDSIHGIKDYFDLLQYHKVDMKYNNGDGKVIKSAVPILKNVPLNRTQMMACRHADGNNWWLLLQGRDTNMVYKFIISEDSVYFTGGQGFSAPKWDHFDLNGQTMFSQDGRHYATLSNGKNTLFVADFNRCDGMLNNPKHYTLPINSRAPSIPTIDTFPTGVCFSPNGQFIYVTTYYNLYQLDLSDPDTTTQWYHVANMDTTYNDFLTWATIYTSPDNKLVIGRNGSVSKSLSLIDSPNVKGIACMFCPNCIKIPTLGAGNPPCMPNYGLGADSALMVGCWPVQTNSVSEESEVWSVYPNPAYQSIFVKNAKGKKKVLYNAMGQVIYSTVKDEIDVSWLSKGVYFLYCDGMAKKVIIE